MRAYTVTAASVALRVPAKLIDNILSHHDVAGVVKSRQGVARRLTPGAILTLEIALRLNQSLRIPLARALELAQGMRRTREEGVIEITGHLSLQADLATIEADLSELLSQAVEIAPNPRRGRPPSQK